MIVSFDPYINNTADTQATYINFLRCVTAIATAPAGTTSLTVNPYTANNAVDGTKNCITSIIANTEAGGWTTSPTTHSLPSYPSNFGVMSTRASYSAMYKADFYNDSSKTGMPYNKLTFHAIGHNLSATNDSIWNGRLATAPLTNWSSANTGGQLQMTFGCSTTSDGDAAYTPTWSSVTGNQQTNSWTNNVYVGNSNGSGASGSNWPGNASGFNLNNLSSVTYTMAVTANYCIIWEVVRGNSYSAGYSNTYTLQFGGGQQCYGAIMYGGLRTTQPWEDTLSNNPPWAAWHVTHIPPNPNYVSGASMTDYSRVDSTIGGSTATGYLYWPYATPQPPNSAAAYMYTIDNTGTVSASPSRFANYPTYQKYLNNINTSHCSVSGSGYQTAAGRMDSFSYNQQGGGAADYLGLVTPLFHQRQRRSQNINGILSTTHNPNLPTFDPQTGSFVPGAYPVKIARTVSGSWNAGGNCRGIYKSLTMPLSTMKLYFADNQTFSVNGEPYMPVVFNEDMYLIRKA